MLLSSSTSHHACALNRSCVEAGALCSGVGHSSTQKWGVVEQCYDFFDRCTVHLDIIKVYYLATDALYIQGRIKLFGAPRQ